MWGFREVKEGHQYESQFPTPMFSGSLFRDLSARTVGVRRCQKTWELVSKQMVSIF